MAKPIASLGEFEIQVLRLVWQHQPCTERQISDLVKQDRSVARTTVLKTLQRLEAKGLLVRAAGRASNPLPRGNRREARGPGLNQQVRRGDAGRVARPAGRVPCRIRQALGKRSQGPACDRPKNGSTAGEIACGKKMGVK